MNTQDSDSVTLMHWAAINNRLELMRYYISKGALVDKPGGELQATPLHWATRYTYRIFHKIICLYLLFINLHYFSKTGTSYGRGLINTAWRRSMFCGC